MKDNPISKTNSKGQSFLHGSLILFIATALVKLIGAIYRIPLANLLGPTGMGFYSTAYDLYVPMYSIAMAGLPIAISRIVAEHDNRRYRLCAYDSRCVFADRSYEDIQCRIAARHTVHCTVPYFLLRYVGLPRIL